MPFAGGVHVLVHNVSAAHDFLLAMQSELTRDEARKLPPDLARPTFHANHPIASKCLIHARELFESDKFTILKHLTDGGDRIPAGFSLGDGGLTVPWKNLKLRCSDHHSKALKAHEEKAGQQSHGTVTACFFPLVALIIPAWIKLCQDAEDREA